MNENYIVKEIGDWVIYQPITFSEMVDLSDHTRWDIGNPKDDRFWRQFNDDIILVFYNRESDEKYAYAPRVGFIDANNMGVDLLDDNDIKDFMEEEDLL